GLQRRVGDGDAHGGHEPVDAARGERRAVGARHRGGDRAGVARNGARGRVRSREGRGIGAAGGVLGGGRSPADHGEPDREGGGADGESGRGGGSGHRSPAPVEGARGGRQRHRDITQHAGRGGGRGAHESVAPI